MWACDVNVTRYNDVSMKQGCVVEWFKAPATDSGLDHPDRRPNPGC